MKIDNIIKIAKERDLSGVAICDHNLFSYPKIKKNISTSENDFFIIPGMEISTELGDLIGILITEEIRSSRFFECIDEIKDKGGISILPHPYRRKSKVKISKLAQSTEWIEEFNSRSKSEQNKKSIELCKKLDKPITAGSDAHLYYEIGASYVKIKNVNNIDDIVKEISAKRVETVKNSSSREVHYWSSIIGVLKTRNLGEFTKGVVREIRHGFK
jgi:predicted metal-dependent phosphoesterase TrpH